VPPVATAPVACAEENEENEENDEALTALLAKLTADHTVLLNAVERALVREYAINVEEDFL
jgi:hypothetical protein